MARLCAVVALLACLGAPARAEDLLLAGEDTEKARVSLCTTNSAAVVRGVEAVSMGMNATGAQIRAAFKDLAKTLRLPMIYAIASTHAEEAAGNRNLQLSMMLGGLTLVFKSPPRQGVHLASCYTTAKATQGALLEAPVRFKIRRDLQWGLALWDDMTRAPYISVCRDPNCKPFGMNEFLPERRSFGDEMYTKKQFVKDGKGSAEDWKTGSIVPYAAEEQIKRSDHSPKENRAASNKGLLGGLKPVEVLLDYDPLHLNLEQFEALATDGSITPAAGSPQKEGTRPNCERGCRFKYPRGPDLVFSAKDTDPDAKKKASLRAIVWESNKFATVKQALEKAGLLGAALSGPYANCARMSLVKYGVVSHTGLWFCPSSNFKGK